MTKISHKGWTIVAAYVGFVATHDDRFDGETGEWQINADSVEEIKEEIDDRAQALRHQLETEQFKTDHVELKNETAYFKSDPR